MTVKTRHPWFSMSGLVARALLTAVKIMPEPADLVIAAAFGVVEVLGVKRLWKTVKPVLIKTIKEQFRASIPNKAVGTEVHQPDSAPSDTTVS